MNYGFGDKRLPPRFWAKVRVTDTCWNWTASLSGGYGQLTMREEVGWRPQRAYRVAYEGLIGPIPDGKELDHLCRNRRCVNPAHLEPVTRSEHNRRGTTPAAQNARKTHCKRGHELRGRNLILVPGGRRCRECVNLRARQRRVQLAPSAHHREIS